MSQNNSTDVPGNTIAALKDEEHKEHTVTQKVKSYFNIYKCVRNLLDRLDVTYQQVSMATPKDKYYNALLDTLVKDNNIRGEPLFNQNIQKAVSDVIEETEAEFERNYNEITCDTSYQSPILKKDVLKINELVYYESNEHVDTISDSSKQVSAKVRILVNNSLVGALYNDSDYDDGWLKRSDSD